MDWDADGTLDFISGSYDPGDLYLFRGLGEGAYAEVEKILDHTGTPLVHHPEQLKKYEEMKDDPDADPEASIQARVASFGSWAAPVDWDADGDLDVLIGSFGGQLYLRTNEGTRAAPIFSAASTQIAGIQVSGHANPVAADWDGDGRWDLVVGASDGSVRWYRNEGTPEVPSFAEARVLVEKKADNKFLRQVLAPDAAPAPGARAQICVVDYDLDGDLDLIVGDHSEVSRKKSGLDEDDLAALDALLAEESSAESNEDWDRARAAQLEYLEDTSSHSAIWFYERRTAPAPPEIDVDAPSQGEPVAAGMALGTAGELAVGAELDVWVRVRIAEGWHVYDLEEGTPFVNTTLALELPEGLTAVGDWERPASVGYPAGGKGVSVWKDEVHFRARVRVDAMPATDAEVACTLAWQACNDSFCLPPESVTLRATARRSATSRTPGR